MEGPSQYRGVWADDAGDDGCTFTEGDRVVEDEETNCRCSMAKEKPRTGECRNHTGLS